MSHARYVFACLIALGGVSGSMILARSPGAGSGFSGGPSGYFEGAGNCTGCHLLPREPVIGGVELIGAPRRYRAGATYDLIVRVFDPEQDELGFVLAGAGFEISVEGAGGHKGELLLTDTFRTRYAGRSRDPDYVTQTFDGFDESRSGAWALHGGSYAYRLRWRAPATDEGPVTFFAAGNAVDDDGSIDGDRYYATYQTSHFAVPGDADGDGDRDLSDFAILQSCFNGSEPVSDETCASLDGDADDTVSLADVSSFVQDMESPDTAQPAGYVLADPIRGGQLYDTWWSVIGVPSPTDNHPLYPEDGPRAGSTTFRCKECHGWDYKGRDGAYATGSHATGIVGVFGTSLTPQQLFDLLKSDDVDAGGHDMAGYGMSDRDIWDVVKMTLEETIDTDPYIDGKTKEFLGDELSEIFGNSYYNTYCAACHDNLETGIQGTWLNFGSESEPEYVGTIANDNPWEFLHKIRFGHPASPMPSLELLQRSLDDMVDIGVFAATLPQ